jgi:4-amino-4-deoxychorismate lyase
VSAEGALRNGNAPGFELIETLRWQPDTGFLRGDRHLARLAASAGALGFSHDPDRIGTALHDAVAGLGQPQRVRLTLARDGAAQCSVQPFQPLPAGTVWRLKLARARLDSANPLLRHKTSRREIFAQARAEYPPDAAEEILLANERGEICEGSFTNLFVDFGDGLLATPPLDCGLLPGILRAELLRQGKAREEILTLDRLNTARALYVGNSLRGLILARLV